MLKSFKTAAFSEGEDQDLFTANESETSIDKLLFRRGIVREHQS